MPTIKNIADYHNQDAILDGNKHYMKLGKYDSSVEGKVVRMTSGLNMSLSINNFPYIDLVKHSCSMDSSIGSSATIRTAGDCFGYVISARDTTNSIKEFKMVCRGTLNNTYPGTYPDRLSMVDIPEIGPVYDGKWACTLKATAGSILDGISSGWRNH